MKRQYMTIGKWQMPGGTKPNPIEVMVALKWIVLQQKEDKALVIVRDCIDWEFFDGSNTFFEPAKPMTWEKSYLRKYLNREFFEKAFSETEKKSVLTTVVRAENNSEYATLGGNDTEDKIFLLSVSEVNKYFMEKDFDARAEMFMIDENHGKMEIESFWHKWWTRTPGEEQNMMSVVNEIGQINLEGIDVDADEIGIRPAMWVDLALLKEK
ncbi:MAG: hypothetical protein IKY23_10325 [Lachnospiraceae bacterium]|nr:hypothetical protein [Lachnospiraceae bacterium]